MEDYQKITIDTYDVTASEYSKNVKELCPMKELEKFVEYIPSKSKIADLGCGSGVSARILTEKGFYVIGFDLSRELLEEAKKESPTSSFVYGDILEIPSRDERFDGIWNVGSIIHIKRASVPIALEEANRILKPKGVMYLAVKAGNTEGFEDDKRYGNKPKWWTYFMLKEIEELLKKANFEVLENYGVEYNDEYRKDYPWMNIFARKN
jgi:ubiquinone/menaquinone biosynthesis C-methylase UbiE